ncbi:MAG: hypothetical protein JST85_04050 [Acidobacteria bacterium]|nr:hypothetical protein [Acidobacteriota bacterium]
MTGTIPGRYEKFGKIFAPQSAGPTTNMRSADRLRSPGKAKFSKKKLDGLKGFAER